MKEGNSRTYSPLSKKTDDEVSRELSVEHLRDKVKVGNKSSLQDDGDVGSVEQLDGIALVHSTGTLGGDGNIHTETLEIDNNHEDQGGGQEVGDVRKVLTVESLTHSSDLITAGSKHVEESDDGTLELRTTTLVDGLRTESLPDDGFADVRGNEQRDTRSQTIALLQQLIEKNDDDTGNEKLNHNQEGVTSTQLSDGTIHARHDVSSSLTNANQDTNN